METLWKINHVECYPEVAGQKDVVSNIHWTVEVVDGETKADHNGVTTLQFDAGVVFVPYDNLTRATLLQWVRDDLSSKLIYEEDEAGKERVVVGNEYDQLITNLQCRVQQQKTPQLISKAVPAI